MDIDSLDLDNDLREKLATKLLAGNQQEWQALITIENEEKEKTAVAGVIDAAAKAVPPLEASGKILFAPDDLPGPADAILIPAGYAISPKGVTITKAEKPKLLTTTPFFIQFRDPGSGQVCITYQLAYTWRSIWVKNSRLNASALADCFIDPEEDTDSKDLLTYAHRCVRVAPFALADDPLSMSAIEILQQLFPYSGSDLAGAHYDFPAFRPFSDVRDKAAEYGVSPFIALKYWRKQGIVRPGNSKVNRTGPKTTARMVVFTAKVLEFLQQQGTHVCP